VRLFGRRRGSRLPGGFVEDGFDNRLVFESHAWGDAAVDVDGGDAVAAGEAQRKTTEPDEQNSVVVGWEPANPAGAAIRQPRRLVFQSSQ
jgi:hypothetical protein